VTQLRSGIAEVSVPEFDRQADQVVDRGLKVSPKTKIILIEGNYLFLDQAHWSDLSDLFDLTINLAPSLDEIKTRLMARWRDLGFDETAALTKAEGNDLPNARQVLSLSRPADIEIDCVVYD